MEPENLTTKISPISHKLKVVLMYIHLQTLDTVNQNKKDIVDGRDPTEEMTASGSLHGLMNCEGFIEYYSLLLIYPAYSVNDNVLNCCKDTGVKIIPQCVRYVEDASSEWAELDYKLKVHSIRSVQVCY